MARRILLADDDPLMTHVLRLKLEDAGYSVVVVANGEEGLRCALADVPDAVVTDLQMPVMDGYQFAIALRADARTARVPIVLLTGRGHILSPEDIEAAAIDQVVPKPFSAREILVLVEKLLDREAAA
jgi:CheY-like chemotaxis protein